MTVDLLQCVYSVGSFILKTKHWDSQHSSTTSSKHSAKIHSSNFSTKFCVSIQSIAPWIPSPSTVHHFVMANWFCAVSLDASNFVIAVANWIGCFELEFPHFLYKLVFPIWTKSSELSVETFESHFSSILSVDWAVLRLLYTMYAAKPCIYLCFDTICIQPLRPQRIENNTFRIDLTRLSRAHKFLLFFWIGAAHFFSMAVK